MQWLKGQGWIVDKTELPFNRFTGKRHDTFGIFDAISAHPEYGIAGVQACAAGTLEQHRRKILSSKYLDTWHRAGGKVLLVEWRKRKARTKDGKYSKKYVWQPKAVFLSDSAKLDTALHLTQS